MNISPMVLKTTKIGSKYGQILNKPSKCQILLKFCTKWQNFAKSGHTDRCNMRRLLVVIQTGDTGLQTELSATLPLHWIEAKYNGKKIQLSIWEGERERERQREKSLFVVKIFGFFENLKLIGRLKRLDD